MSRRRAKRHGAFRPGVLFIVVLPFFGSGACNGSASTTPSSMSSGTAPAPCNVRADCPTYGVDAQTWVCFFGRCTVEGSGCTTPCSGVHRGLTCVHSGVKAHCDGCVYDSACLWGEECEMVTGHPCTPDLDAGPRPPVVEAPPCPPGLTCLRL
jgi:hypothetical protein